MFQFGPFLVFSDGVYTEWCFFRLNDAGVVDYVIAPYIEGQQHPIEWSVSPWLEDQKRYVIDPITKRRFCYFVQDSQLYEVPMQEKQGVISYVHQVRFDRSDSGVQRVLVRARAREVGVVLEQYASLDRVPFDLAVPMLPNQVELPIERSIEPEPAFISIFDAWKMLDPMLTDLSQDQQGMVVNILSYDWPLQKGMSLDVQKEICRAILVGDLIALEEERWVAQANLFRSYLFPSGINRWSVRVPDYQSIKLSVLYEFACALLETSIQHLGGESPVRVPASLLLRETHCGSLAETRMSRLIYNGLSEGQSELFRLIMVYQYTQLEQMNFSELSNLCVSVNRLISPSSEADSQETMNDLLAALSAQGVASQTEALAEIRRTCDAIIVGAQQAALQLVLQMTAQDYAQFRQNEFPQLQVGIGLGVYLKEHYPQDQNIIIQLVQSYSILKKLADAGVLSKIDVMPVIRHQHTNCCAKLIIYLFQMGFLTPSVFDLAHRQSLSKPSLTLLQLLQENNMLNERNICLVLSHQKVADLHFLCKQLARVNGFTQIHFEKLIRHRHLESLKDIVELLCNNEWLRQSFIPLVLSNRAPVTLYKVFFTLSVLSSLMNHHRVFYVLNHRSIGNLLDVLTGLYMHKLLDQIDLDLLLVHGFISGLSMIFRQLEVARLLTKDNVNAILRHRSPVLLTEIIKHFHNTMLLTEDRLAQLLGHAHLTVLSERLDLATQNGQELTPLIWMQALAVSSAQRDARELYGFLSSRPSKRARQIERMRDAEQHEGCRTRTA